MVDPEVAENPQERLDNAIKEEYKDTYWCFVIFLIMMVMFVSNREAFDEFSQRMPEVRSITITTMVLYGLSTCCHFFWARTLSHSTINFRTCCNCIPYLALVVTNIIGLTVAYSDQFN